MVYEITIDNGQGTAVCVTRYRENAALFQLETAIYRAAEAQGLRDTKIAHAALKTAHSWTKRHPIPPIRLGSYIINIFTSKLP